MLALTTIGVLLPVPTIVAMRGLWAYTMAMCTTTLSTIPVIFVVSEQESNELSI